MGEITVILLLAIIFLGPKKLPDLASGLGKIIRDIRKATSDVKNEIALDDTFRKPFEELRDAVTLHPDELKRRDELKRSLEDIRKRAEAVEAESQALNASESADDAGPTIPDGMPAVTPEAGAALAAVEGTDASEDTSVPAPFGSAPPTAEPLFAPPTPPPPAPSFQPTPLAALRARTPSGAHKPLSDLSGVHAPPPPPAARVTPSAPHPAVPAAPPTGTVAAPPTRLGPPRVTPPVSSLSSDKSNTTQSLSEEDLLPPAGASPPAAPGRRTSPPPLPGIVKPPPVPPGSKKTS